MSQLNKDMIPKWVSKKIVPSKTTLAMPPRSMEIHSLRTMIITSTALLVMQRNMQIKTPHY